MEHPAVTAVAHRAPCSIAIAQGTPGGRGEARGLIESVAERHPELELVAHEQDEGRLAAVVWIGERAEVEALEKHFRALRGPGGEWKLMAEHGAAFVSLVGLGLGASEVAKAETALERAGVSMVALRVTPTALIFRVAADRAEGAVRALHAAFLEPAPAPAAARR